MFASASVAAVGLSCWLAQAEPAPAEPTPTPAAAAPSPAEPAPPAAAPGAAEPAPDPAPARRPSSMSVAARYARRLGAESTTLAPTSGFSLGATYQRRYLLLAERVGLGVDADLYYDHFAADVQT